MLMKKSEISVPEDKKGKQIAVKESNITSLKDFFVQNYKEPVETSPVEPQAESSENIIQETTDPIPTMINPSPIEVNPLNVINPFETPEIDNNIIMNAPENNTILEQQSPALEEQVNVMAEAPVFPESPVTEQTVSVTPIIGNEENSSVINNMINPVEEEESGTNDAQAIKLTPEAENVVNTSNMDEEMDPELQEIKNRLDQVIMDLNNYKKKIKMLEDEVNQNLEKSREVLKDTQAAAKIMSIHQERQKQILNEMKNEPLVNETGRILEKDVA